MSIEASKLALLVTVSDSRGFFWRERCCALIELAGSPVQVAGVVIVAVAVASATSAGRLIGYLRVAMCRAAGSRDPDKHKGDRHNQPAEAEEAQIGSPKPSKMTREALEDKTIERAWRVICILERVQVARAASRAEEVGASERCSRHLRKGSLFNHRVRCSCSRPRSGQIEEPPTRLEAEPTGDLIWAQHESVRGKSKGAQGGIFRLQDETRREEAR